MAKLRRARTYQKIDSPYTRVSKSRKKPFKADKEVDSQIAELRNQGMGNYDIADALGIPNTFVESRIKSLIEVGKVKRLRARRRTPEEISIDDEKVKKLKIEGKKAHEIAELIDRTPAVVMHTSERLYNSNKLPLKRQAERKKGRADAIILDMEVEGFFRQGLSRKEISDHLGISMRELEASISRILRLEKRRQRSLPDF